MLWLAVVRKVRVFPATEEFLEKHSALSNDEADLLGKSWRKIVFRGSGNFGDETMTRVSLSCFNWLIPFCTATLAIDLIRFIDGLQIKSICKFKQFPTIENVK